jgi:predicted HTH domain antitoxin
MMAEVSGMAEIEIQFSFKIPVSETLLAHRAEAERKAREAFVMELLRHGDISTGRAARMLDIDRWQLSELMFAHQVSPFDETMTKEDLLCEVADAANDWSR